MMNKWSPHPKHEPSTLTKPSPLNEKQQTQLFIHSVLNLQNLNQPPSINEHKKPQNNLLLAEHLLAIPPEVSSAISMKQKQNREKRKAKAFHDTTLTITEEDEESQYQSYLKEYSTVVKNSRKKEYISPQAQKNEMEELITQFLGGPGPEPELHQPKSRQPSEHKTSKRKEKSRVKTSNEDPSVRVEKIDLSHVKPKPNANSKPGLQKSTEKKRDETPIKHIDITPYMKDENYSPRFTNTQKSKAKKKITSRIKIPNKIEVVRVEDLREKKQMSRSKVNQPKQLIKQAEKQQESANSVPGYSIAHIQKQKDSYLKKNLHKTIKPHKEHSRPSDLHSHQGEKTSMQTSQIHKKPIKIQIQIPLDQNQSPLDAIYSMKDYSVESSLSLQRQQTEIIKQISQKVLSLIDKTKHLTPKRGGP